MARFHVGSRAACGLKATKFYTTKSHKSHGKWFDIPYILWSGVANIFWNVKIVVPLLVFWSISFANKEKFQSTMDGVAVFTYSARLSTGPVTTASLSLVSWGTKKSNAFKKGTRSLISKDESNKKKAHQNVLSFSARSQNKKLLVFRIKARYISGDALKTMTIQPLEWRGRSIRSKNTSRMFAKMGRWDMSMSIEWLLGCFFRTTSSKIKYHKVQMCTCAIIYGKSYLAVPCLQSCLYQPVVSSQISWGQLPR